MILILRSLLRKETPTIENIKRSRSQEFIALDIFDFAALKRFNQFKKTLNSLLKEIYTRPTILITKIWSKIFKHLINQFSLSQIERLTKTYNTFTFVGSLKEIWMQRYQSLSAVFGLPYNKYINSELCGCTAFVGVRDRRDYRFSFNMRDCPLIRVKRGPCEASVGVD